MQEEATKQVFAVKVMNKIQIVSMDLSMALIERNVLALHRSSPFIARLKASFQTPGHVFMVMEYFHGGDLQSHLFVEGVRKCYSSNNVRFVAAQILEGLWYVVS